MTKITGIYKTRLKHASHIKVMQKFQAKFEALGVASLPFAEKAQSLYNAFASAVTKEAADYKKATASSLTGEIAEADAQRDAAWQTIVTVGKALAVNGSDAQKAEAVKLNAIVSNYSIDTASQYDQESGMLDQAINDIDTQTVDMSVLALATVYQTLKTQTALVDSLLDQRDENRAGTVTGLMKTDRATTDTAYDNLVEYVNAVLVVQTSEALTTFAEYWNSVLNRVRVQILGTSTQTDVDVDDDNTESTETPSDDTTGKTNTNLEV